jgi:hypothetical protein
LPGNPPGGNYIQIAESPGAAISIEQSYPLVPNESVALRVKNTKEVFASANFAGGWLVIMVELRRRGNA